MSSRESRRSSLFVGIGASAGGLPALRSLFEAMSAPCGMTFIVVTHLSPDHESYLAEILAPHTELTVETATDGVELEDDHVYVIPPGCGLAMSDRRLALTPLPRSAGIPQPIDAFFRSLAEAQHERAVCIVLSGAGSEGARGLEAVKAAGGLTIVQSPGSASVSSMPAHAVATEMVDHVLEVREIPALLRRYAEHPYSSGELEPEDGAEESLARILERVHRESGHDFSGYREATMLRRVLRRMGLLHLPTVEAYARYLDEDALELTRLSQDLLINVTHFFRDPEAWRALNDQVVSFLVADCEPTATVRAWVPGCATGEEAYTLAILFMEAFDEAKKACRLQIFATDRSERSIQFGRAGTYPASIALDVSPERLTRHFERQADGSFVVAKRLRDLVVFARHDALSDPPFSHLDLITCRNLLIYLEQSVQERLLALFHFVLDKDRFLFLGSAETANQMRERFVPIDNEHRIYRRVGPQREHRTRLSPRAPDSVKVPSTAVRRAGLGQDPASARLAERALLQVHAPPSIVVRQDFEVVYFHGAVQGYLTHPAGAPTRDLLAMLDERLRARLRAAMRRVVRDHVPVRVPPLRVSRDDGTDRTLVVTITPVSEPQAEPIFIISLEESAAEETEAQTRKVDDSPLVQLERELQAARDDLDANVAEIERANEELTAANEEVTSMNEELQSTNEELETSREELRSLNEELATVNNQLQTKVHELERAGSDLANLLSSTHIGTLFLDPEFTVKRFTPAMTQLLNLRPSDLGRPLSDFALKFTDPSMLEDALAVLQDRQPREAEIQADDGRWFVRRALPYVGEDNGVEGVVLTFNDVTRLKTTEQRLRSSEELFRRVSEVGLVNIAFFDAEGRITDANDAFLEAVGKSRANIESGAFTWSQLVEASARPGLDELLATIRDGRPAAQAELPLKRRDGGRWWGLLAAAMLAGEPQHGIAFVVDVTARHEAEADVRALAASLERRVAERAGHVQLLRDVAVISNEADRLEEGLEQAVQRFCQHLGRGGGRVYLKDDGRSPQGTSSQVAWYRGPDCERIGARRHRALVEPGELVQRVIDTGQAQFQAAPAEGSQEARTQVPTPPLGPIGDEAQDGPQSRGAVAFPILVGEQVVGVVELDWQAAAPPGESLLSVMAQSGAQLGRVVERYRSRVALRSLASELAESEQRERRELATRLHDDLGQRLAAAQMKLRLLQDDASGTSLMAGLDQVRELIREGIDASRSLTVRLSPPPLSELGLEAALQWICEDVGHRFGLDVDCVDDGQDKPLDEATRFVMYRAVSELLVNVAKHSGVSSACVRIERDGRHLRVTVSDGGVGFSIADVTGVPGTGFGLFSIQERIEHLGGSVAIETGDGEGTRVRILVPLDVERADAE
ncbi:MAG: PAS domain-containing protein [Deltaproteobacteria bacterium]|nr:PAS domain-containing protein [Deltaproteobacteria bacterium]MCB9786358.1 PAS domain-containing protein [Deltaproteobacteria bacterium]